MDCNQHHPHFTDVVTEVWGAWRLIQGCTVGQWWSWDPNPGRWLPHILISVLFIVLREPVPPLHPTLPSSTLASLSYSLTRRNITGPPFALQRRTVEAWIGKAEPEKYQPFAKFCPFVLRVLSASLRCSSKTLWPFRHAPIPYIFMIPFVATLCPSLTLGFCAIYLFSGIV